MTNEEEEVELFGDPGIKTAHAKVPTFLKLIYLILPLWGILWLYLFWDGSWGWFDRGYWQQLQRAANTTFYKDKYEKRNAAPQQNEMHLYPHS